MARTINDNNYGMLRIELYLNRWMYMLNDIINKASSIPNWTWHTILVYTRSELVFWTQLYKVDNITNASISEYSL